MSYPLKVPLRELYVIPLKASTHWWQVHCLLWLRNPVSKQRHAQRISDNSVEKCHPVPPENVGNSAIAKDRFLVIFAHHQLCTSETTQKTHLFNLQTRFWRVLLSNLPSFACYESVVLITWLTICFLVGLLEALYNKNILLELMILVKGSKI